MFEYTLPIYINLLLLMKDEEIYNNFLQLNELFIKYSHNEINKDFLLDEHTNRNKIFIQWDNIYKYGNQNKIIF